jgi:hypothetical protein
MLTSNHHSPHIYILHHTACPHHLFFWRIGITDEGQKVPSAYQRSPQSSLIDTNLWDSSSSRLDWSIDDDMPCNVHFGLFPLHMFALSLPNYPLFRLMWASFAVASLQKCSFRQIQKCSFRQRRTIKGLMHAIVLRLKPLQLLALHVPNCLNASRYI